MELEQREGTMAAVGFEEFSAPPGSELALPPLFGGHILESELETEVEFVSGGLGSSGLRERDEEEEAARGRRRRQRELNRRKYQALGRRCREMEQVGECGVLFRGPWPKLPPLPGSHLPPCPPVLGQAIECLFTGFSCIQHPVWVLHCAQFSSTVSSRTSALITLLVAVTKYLRQCEE
uniref:TCF3 fusion partner n=1 Tax=Nannospalax galili TaxID=1026970 RepID=A0A8C6R525_NANGA